MCIVLEMEISLNISCGLQQRAVSLFLKNLEMRTSLKSLLSSTKSSFAFVQHFRNENFVDFFWWFSTKSSLTFVYNFRDGSFVDYFCGLQQRAILLLFKNLEMKTSLNSPCCLQQRAASHLCTTLEMKT